MLCDEMKVICDYCGNDAEFVSGREIYPNRPDLASNKFWRCVPCGAYVGCHNRNKKLGFSGDEPKGRLAKATLRRAKIAAHAAFDPLWQYGDMTRTEAYQWLANAMCRQLSEVHIGYFDTKECKEVIFLVNERNQK
jgi:hypothetical protein